MSLLPCGHDAPASAIRLCKHLLGATQAKAAHFRLLRGVRLDCDLCCHTCGDRVKNGENIELFAACAACLAVFDDLDYCEWIGTPGIEERLVAFDQSLETRQFPALLAEAKALTPLLDGRVLALVGDELQIFDERGATILVRVVLPDEEVKSWHSSRPLTPRLLVSKNARFAALVNDYGRYGTVVDIEKGCAAMSLDRGDYHPEQTPFPAAFFEFGARTLLVHGTEWNRLDVSDPQTGELISVRPSPLYGTGEKSAHDLDYFHGRLQVSPNGEWILDAGWVWHPLGAPCWWNLSRWMSENVWESEDGDSRRDPIYREPWNVPMAWLDERRLAVWGLGFDGDAMLAGARIFEAPSGVEIMAFAGPDGTFFGDGTRLYSAEKAGLEIWDVEAGARLGRILGFRPNFQIEGALIEISGSLWRSWNCSESF